MPQEKQNKINTPICKNLRTKMYYVNVANSQEAIANEEDISSTQYWCLKTMQPIGPDDGYVHRDKCCSPSRKCFEPPDI